MPKPTNTIRFGAIEEIGRSEVPGASPYWPLAQQLALRLEKTTADYALRVSFDTLDEAELAGGGVRRELRARLGAQAVSFRIAPDEDGNPCLFVWRGPHYPGDAAPQKTNGKYARKPKGEKEETL